MVKNNRSNRIVTVAAIALTIFASLFISWANNAYPADETALQALKSDERVTVIDKSGAYIFEPANAETKTGFIFYPGGRVDYRAYAAPLREIASQGYFVALIPAPLNLAFFNADAAAQIIGLYPNIENWSVGGHSLGGVIASGYAVKDPQIAGLVLWASYPADDSLANRDLKVLSIYGTRDMAGMDVFEETKLLLPAATIYTVIDGGNHAQFGNYGEQSGDLTAAISREEQQAQTVSATIAFLTEITK